MKITSEELIERVKRIKSTDTLLLWTIQTWEVWEKLRSRGVHLVDDPAVMIPPTDSALGKIEVLETDDPFLFAYEWMRQQMAKRLPKYSGGYLIWLWYYPKPDLRYTGYLPGGTRGVRIEIVVPASRILLSDFDAWSCVLNQTHLDLSEAEETAFSQLLPKGQSPLYNYHQLPQPLQRMIEESWKRIFDFETLYNAWRSNPNYNGPLRYVQAVIEEIRLEEVVRVKEFTARKSWEEGFWKRNQDR